MSEIKLKISVFCPYFALIATAFKLYELHRFVYNLMIM